MHYRSRKTATGRAPALAACCAVALAAAAGPAAAEACRIAIAAHGIEALPAGARETLRLVAERSEVRDSRGRWQRLEGHCEPADRAAADAVLARCSLPSACGPHQLLLRFEWLAGLTGVATATRSALVPVSGWAALTEGTTVSVDVAQLLVAGVPGPRARRVPR